MVDAWSEPTYEEKMRVPPPNPWGLSINSSLCLLNAFKWAFVLVSFCSSGLLSWWAFVKWAFVLHSNFFTFFTFFNRFLLYFSLSLNCSNTIVKTNPMRVATTNLLNRNSVLTLAEQFHKGRRRVFKLKSLETVYILMLYRFYGVFDSCDQPSSVRQLSLTLTALEP